MWFHGVMGRHILLSLVMMCILLQSNVYDSCVSVIKMQSSPSLSLITFMFGESNLIGYTFMFSAKNYISFRL